MEEITRLKASRRGHKGHLTKLISKAEEFLKKQGHLTEVERVSVTNTFEQLKKKSDILNKIGEQIQGYINEEEDLVAEILEHEEMQEEIAEVIAKLSLLIFPPHVHPISPSISSVQHVSNQTPVVSYPSPITTQSGITHTSSRLPKLNLPTFSGDPLEWLSFWDSFKIGVHQNPNLPDVDKFNYLKAQFSGDAERSIAGYPLTNDNYTRAINSLQERFGQNSKLINAHMAALLELPHPNNHPSSLRSFYDTMETNIRALEALGKSQDNFGDLLIPVIMGKLPDDTKRNLARGQQGEEWNIQELRQVFKRELKVLESGSNPPLGPTPTASFFTGVKGSDNQGRKKGTFKPKTRSCVFCKEDHMSHKCTVVTDPQSRKSIVTNEKRCYNCLATSHLSSKCPSKFRCKHCNGKHHTSICEKGDQPSPSPPPHENKETPTPGNNAPKSVHTAFTPAHKMVHDNPILLKTAISKVKVGTVSRDANILLDEGAQRSFITKELADKLQAKPYAKESIATSAFGSTERAFNTFDVVSINVITEQNQKIPLRVLVAPTISTPLYCEHNSNLNDVPHLKGLKLAHPVSSNGKFEINLLIGADYYWDIVQDKIIRGVGGPTAVQSKLGYLLSGPLSTAGTVRGTTHICYITTQIGEFDIERFWSLESMGISPINEGSYDQSFLKNYQNTSITRDGDGAYKAAFPWKDNHQTLPTNLSICEKRTRTTARRLHENPDLLKCYNEIIKEQETRGFIEKVENPDPSDHAHYIPHHPVKKDSSTTPIRIVYDCSCRQGPNSPSLNDCLDVGPPFLVDMGSILIRFRTHPIGISTEIEKAFLHVRLDEHDRDMTRFLWLSDPEDPESEFLVYRFKSVLFGSTSSPFMLNAALHTHLESFDTPVVQDMMDNLYVDNIITGCDTDEKAEKYYKESREVMSDANFNLRSWSSNSKVLREMASNDSVLDMDGDNVKVLGLRWNTSTDTLTLTQKALSTSDTPITKREILRESSKIHDPLGLIAPVSVNAKILMQDIWQLNVDWDEPLEDAMKDRWLKIAEDVQLSSSTTLPRCYFNSPSSTATTQLHIFADASPKAYGAVA